MELFIWSYETYILTMTSKLIEGRSAGCIYTIIANVKHRILIPLVLKAMIRYKFIIY